MFTFLKSSDIFQHSTSRHVEVATRFAGTAGIVLQLNNTTMYNKEFLHGFDCCWFSSFREEDETLFMGGHYKVTIESVTTVEKCKNYRLLFKAMGIFDEMINGKYAPAETDEYGADKKVTAKEKSIIITLYSWRLGEMKEKYDEIPKYVYDTFLLYTKDKKQIILNSYLLDTEGEKELNGLVVSDLKSEKSLENGSWNNVNVFRKQIFAIFDNLESILLYTTRNWNAWTECVYPFSFIHLLSIIKEIEFKKISVKALCYKYENESWLSRVWESDAVQLIKAYKQYGIQIYLAERTVTAEKQNEDCMIIVK